MKYQLILYKDESSHSGKKGYILCKSDSINEIIDELAKSMKENFFEIYYEYEIWETIDETIGDIIWQIKEKSYARARQK